MVFLFRNMKIKKILLILIFRNAIDNISAGKINAEKSFDQIFGQKWEEKEEENGENETDQNGRIIGQTDGQNEAKNGEINAQLLHETQFDQNLQVKQETSTNFDQLEQLGTNFEQISDDFSNAINKKKREIVKKFDKIKENVKQMGRKYSAKEWQRIERKIAKKLGTNQWNIYKWKREFGMIKKHYYTDERRLQILKRFDQIYGKIKKKLKGKFDGNSEKYQKILAKNLGINISSIYKWKKQLKNGNCVKNQNNDEEKRQIVEKYFKTKIKFMQNGKHSQKEWKEFRAKIKQKIGMNYKTIEKWAKKLKINQNISKEQKMLSIAEKMEKIKQYYQVKEQNPKLKEYEIAKILNIPTSSLRKYKAKFGIKHKNKLL